MCDRPAHARVDLGSIERGSSSRSTNQIEEQPANASSSVAPKVERERSGSSAPGWDSCVALEPLRSRSTFGATELEAFAGCSSIWFVERLLDPRSMDPEVDARCAARSHTRRSSASTPGCRSGSGAEQVPADRLDEALEFLRECLDEAIAGGAEARLELTDLQRDELRQGLWRDLEALVQAEAESQMPLVPRRFEVSFGSERSAPELQRGLDLGTFHLTGKIDRIDLDPFAARGIVWDYKSGKTAHSATQIEKELKLQIPLYMLVLRDLVGVEPLGGLYRPLSGDRKARGLLRASAKTDGVPGGSRNDYVDDDDFWAQVERAQDTARGIVERIRSGDVRHDPLGGCVPAVVQARLDLPDQERLMAATVDRPPTPEQDAAIQAEGLVFVSAGAGTGKTSVLVERFARAIDQGSTSPRSRHHLHRARRGRAALADSRAPDELGRPELTRELDGAWISTIHGFCTAALAASTRSRPGSTRASA